MYIYSDIKKDKECRFKRMEPMVIQHNISGMNANRQYGMTTVSQRYSAEKLSTGYKINRSADDAAGLGISETMRRQVRGLTQASSNAQDGISLVQIADGALNEVHDMLQRGNEISIKAATDTLTDDDRSYINEEVKRISSEIESIANKATFNEILIFPPDGAKVGHESESTVPDIYLQVGSETDPENEVGIKRYSLSAEAIGIDGVNTATRQDSLEAIDKFKSALTNVSEMRSYYGSIQNRLEHTIKNLDNTMENTQSAESSVRDTDMAKQMFNFSNLNILSKAGESVLAQANQSNSGVLTLLS